MILCTGRAMGMVPKEYMQLGFHGIIAAAGLHIICEGKELFNRTIPDSYIRKVISYGKEAHIGTVLEGTNARFFDEEMLKEPYFKKVVDSLFENTTPTNYPIDDQVSMINKWTYHHLNPKRKKEVEDILDGLVTGVVHSRVQTVDFIQAGMNKATGVETVLDYFSMDQKNSYAFGDETVQTI